MGQRKLNLDEYALERGNEIHDVGAEVTSHQIMELPDGTMIITAQLKFSDDVVLQVFEHVALRNEGASRVKYSYHAQRRSGGLLFRYDRDPRHEADGLFEHKHAPPAGRRIACSRVTLRDVTDELWQMIGGRSS